MSGTEQARWVRDNRRAKGLTQPELAEAVGVSHKTIFRAERGESLSAYTLDQLTRYFGKPLPHGTGQDGHTGHFVLTLYREYL